jgi:hypothetical protein
MHLFTNMPGRKVNRCVVRDASAPERGQRPTACAARRAITARIAGAEARRAVVSLAGERSTRRPRKRWRSPRGSGRSRPPTVGAGTRSSTQLVVGINPDPERYDGVLVRHCAERAEVLVARAAAGRVEVEERTTVEVVLDDGQRLRALNEIFVGHRTHQSARYRLRARGGEERQSSSGIVVSTGTGSSGWARSIVRERARVPEIPAPSQRSLLWLVREAFPSVATGTTATAGTLDERDRLEVVSEMNTGGVVFGDGLETDALTLGWGVQARIGVAAERLRLVVGT